jgi:hypothetical protein
MAGIGASRPFPRVAATVCFLITERALSLGGRNWSSCPVPAVRIRNDRDGRGIREAGSSFKTARMGSEEWICSKTLVVFRIEGIVDATRLIGIQVDDMGGEIEGSIPSARIEDARRPPSNLAQLRQVRTQDHRSFGKDASGERGAGNWCPVMGRTLRMRIDFLEGSVDWVHQFRRPLLSNRERQTLRVPLRSRSQTLRHRRLTRSHHRFRYPGQTSRQ